MGLTRRQLFHSYHSGVTELNWSGSIKLKTRRKFFPSDEEKADLSNSSMFLKWEPVARLVSVL